MADVDFLVTVAASAIAVMLLVLTVRIFSAPLRWLWRLVCSSLLGFLVLALIDLLCSPFGIRIGFNLVNAVVIGILGLPGAALLLLVKYLI